jgi:hypothetical protein
MVAKTTNVALPDDVYAKLLAEATKLGLDVPAYVALLSRIARPALDSRARDAARFALTSQHDSLRKLAQ